MSNIIYLNFSGACGIKTKDMIVVTGGSRGEARPAEGSLRRVIAYNSQGSMESSMPFPNLLTDRRLHACGHFTDTDANLVLTHCLASL